MYLFLLEPGFDVSVEYNNLSVQDTNKKDCNFLSLDNHLKQLSVKEKESRVPIKTPKCQSMGPKMSGSTKQSSRSHTSMLNHTSMLTRSGGNTCNEFSVAADSAENVGQQFSRNANLNINNKRHNSCGGSQHYKNAVQWMSTPGNTVNDSVVVRDSPIVEGASGGGHPHGSKKKKRKKKGANASPSETDKTITVKEVKETDEPMTVKNMTVKGLPFGTRLGISSRLDRSDRWEPLALLFKYDSQDTEALKKSKIYGGSPSESLLYKLQTQYPNLTVETFIQKCQQVKYSDIIEYIEERIKGQKI